MTIDVRQLTVHLGGRTVLREITGTIATGRITAVLGPNAAGKSTLLRAIIGSVRPAGGDVKIAGVSTAAMSPPAIARRIAFVAQRGLMTSALTARQVVELGRFVLGPSLQRVDGALGRMDLRDVADVPFNWLSAGQQQRVMVARALAQVQTDGWLILDEPTTSMDIRHAHVIGSVTREHVRGGGGVIMTLHDISLASAWADDAWLIQDGRLDHAGPANALSPERLSEVFGVEFGRVTDPDGNVRIMHAM